jgi:DNA invertase Pin-like site-specific DNA recombinase
MARPQKTAPRLAGGTARIRCAIYTRKSTEEGLEQEFNSLDAQYEACSAYILSQRHEGWALVKARYDDGGISGGTMDRPGLQRLLSDVRQGHVDVIVVYKVDRLTRSLTDFAKIVDILDARSASFVSVTQAFNTTTSMGRLTLNVLLSFAQFEREVTGERIRDKIAAAKKKGLWMGGPVPLGYDVENRKLVVNETEAALVLHIYERYLALPSVKDLERELGAQGYRTKVQRRTSGPHKGGVPFRRGTLYHLLSNRTYLGEIVHRGQSYPGEHPAIVPLSLWTAVKAKLATRGPGAISASRMGRVSHLIGLLYDGLGRPMTSSHTSRGTRRYRYYATRDATKAEPAWRVAAFDIEQLIHEKLRTLLTDRHELARRVASIDPHQIESVASRAQACANQAELLSALSKFGVGRIDLNADQLNIHIDERALLTALGMTLPHEHVGSITLSASVERVRRGHDLKLIIPAEAQAIAPAASRDEGLIELLAEAMEMRAAVMAAPSQSISAFANSLGKCRKRITRLLQISWLAPDIVRAIVDGWQPPTLNKKRLMQIALPICWQEQKTVLGF